MGYGPQENATREKKNKFWDFLENEIREAEVKDHGVILQMDGNLHCGNKIVPGGKNENKY